MSWPQWTWIVLVGLSWLIVLANHGKPRKGNYDIGICTAAAGVHIFLLWQGGFFG